MDSQPVQCLGKLYDKLIKTGKQNLYRATLIKLPMPKLVVFYNGKMEADDEVILKLSDAFPKNLPVGESDVELRVRMLNVNAGSNEKLLESCKPLKEYAWLIDKIRKNKVFMEIEPAVDAAIDEMPDEFEIKDYLIGHRAEVKDMCITEYNEAETMQMFKEEGREEGIIIFIEDKLDDHYELPVIKERLIKRFDLDERKAEEYIQKCVNAMQTQC